MSSFVYPGRKCRFRKRLLYFTTRQRKTICWSFLTVNGIWNVDYMSAAYFVCVHRLSYASANDCCVQVFIPTLLWFWERFIQWDGNRKIASLKLLIFSSLFLWLNLFWASKRIWPSPSYPEMDAAIKIVYFFYLQDVGTRIIERHA